jgi:hypothetical protein
LEEQKREMETRKAVTQSELDDVRARLHQVRREIQVPKDNPGFGQGVVIGVVVGAMLGIAAQCVQH